MATTYEVALDLAAMLAQQVAGDGSSPSPIDPTKPASDIVALADALNTVIGALASAQTEINGV